jgi:predicted DNA-binding transcriptional regulator YafY
MLWEDCPASDGQPIPLRTFHEHRKGIKEMFGVEIVCDRSKGNVYYVKNPEVLEEKKLEKWLLRKYSIPQDFVTFNAMKDRILLEEIPQGQAFLNPIIEAMQTNVELRIDYQRYEQEREEHLQTFHFQPYALKVYNRRWYLLGFLKEQNALRIISLDRILNLKVLKTTFELPSNFDARNYFANMVGIFVNEDLPMTKVKIRAYGVQVEYLRSTPLHKTQSEGRSKHGEFAEFTYRLCITPDLVTQLLAMGDKIEVLEPATLREIIKEQLQSILNRYGKE